MTPEEFVKEYNAKEIMFKLPWMSQSCHSVVLASLTEGVSIKPYFIDDKEKERLIKDEMRCSGYEYDYCKQQADKADYCFGKLQADEFKTPFFLDFKQCIDEGEVSEKLYREDSEGVNPICPFT